MKRLKLFLAMFSMIALMAGCICTKPSHKLINVNIPVPTAKSIDPIKQSSAKLTDSGTKSVKLVDEIQAEINSKPTNEVSIKIKPIVDSLQREIAVMLATIGEMNVWIDGLVKQLETCKAAYDNELNRLVKSASESDALKLAAKEKELTETKKSLKEVTDDRDKEKQKREETEKVMEAGVASSWRWLSYFGAFMIVGGVIGTAVCGYLKMGVKITIFIAACGLACMIIASALPRMIVVSTTSFKWIMYSATGCIVLLVIAFTIMLIMHGNIHELLDKWSAKTGATDPRKLPKTEKDKLYIADPVVSVDPLVPVDPIVPVDTTSK